MHRTQCMNTLGVTQEVACPVELVLFTVINQNRSWTLKAPQSQKWLQSVSMFLTKFTWLIFFGDKAMFYTKRFWISTTKVQLRWRITARIQAQVIQGTFLSGISLLRVVGIMKSLVSSTAAHRRCFLTSSLKHCKSNFSDVSGNSLWYYCMSTSCKIMFHL